jgi:hypothetical protein
MPKQLAAAGPRPRRPAKLRLLLRAQNRVLGSFGDSKLNHRLSRNLDLLLGLRVDTETRLPLLFNQLAEARQRKFAFFLDGFISKAAKGIEEKRGRSFIGLSRRGDFV